MINSRYDTIESTKIYLDHVNKRVKIMDCTNISALTLEKIIDISIKEQAGKIIGNCTIDVIKHFLEAGFCNEGKINGFFKGEDAYCMSYFVDGNRKVSTNPVEKDLIINQSLNMKHTYIAGKEDNPNYIIRTATPKDAKQMVELFTTVFSSYPTPVYDEEYIKQTMKEQILYKVVVWNDKIIGIASADLDLDNLNAEMTDCATNPEYRGKGILTNIMYHLELELKNRRFLTLYSLSRAINPSINMVLSKHNYSYTGRLINNCNICGSFEDMNIWVKNIKE